MEFILIFGFGLLIGSFLNVCIYRLPKNESICYPPSHCTTCGHRLYVLDLIPVISYLLSKGHCRYCQEPFSSRYAFIELLTGILFSWCYFSIGFQARFIEALVITSFLIVITFIDLDHQLILDKVLLCFAVSIVAMHLFFQYFSMLFSFFSLPVIFDAINPDYIDLVLGGLLGGSILLLIAIISRGGMGGGDIKFTAVMGLFLGVKLLLIGLFIAFFVGGMIGLLLLLSGKKKRKDTIPFGPFLAIGMFISMLYGAEILTWYFTLF